ncbi:tyrosine recombinase XerC [Georgenia sp. AZ-5]|uniref:site-specific integrase n=1 Tax=Georgenia sp. AZ-5 TaxID=3367526 RepID=UPI0037552922
MLKPGEHGEIFISRHKSGSYQARVRVRLLNGEVTQVSRNRKSGPAARLAVQAEIDALLNAPRGSAQLKPDSRVGLAARQWIDELRVQSMWPNPPRRPQTVDEYERLLGMHLVPKLGKYRLHELTTAVCQDWINSIIDGGTKGPYDMVVTAVQIRGAFKAVLDRAIVHDALRFNPMDKTTTPRRKVPDPKAMTVSDVYRLRKAVRDWEAARQGRSGPRPTGHVPAAVDVMLGTGLRIGEALALNWGEVNLSPDGLPTIAVDATLVDIKGKGTIRQEMPKTDAGKRTIIIPRFTVESLEAIRPETTTAEMPVFPSRQFKDGRASMTPQTPHNVRRTLRAALELAHMKGEVHPHLLRSTVATFVARERGTADAATLLGHKINGGVTARHYIERLRLAPDTSAVLQAMVEIGEEQAVQEAVRAVKAAKKETDLEVERGMASTMPATTEELAAADEQSGW